jgi:hypothetical protein
MKFHKYLFGRQKEAKNRTAYICKTVTSLGNILYNKFIKVHRISRPNHQRKNPAERRIWYKE